MRRPAQALGKLVLLVEQAGIARIGAARPRVSVGRLAGIAKNIEIRDTEVAPDDGKFGVQPRGLLPLGDCIAVAAAVVKNISQIVGGAGVARIGGRRGLQNQYVFQARWEAIRRIGRRGLTPKFLDQRRIAKLISTVRAVVKKQGRHTVARLRRHGGQ